MSIRINDGLKYRYKDKNDVGKFHRKLINIAQDHYSRIYTEITAQFALDLIINLIAFHDQGTEWCVKNTVNSSFHMFNDEGIEKLVQEAITENVIESLEKAQWNEDNIQSLFDLLKGIITIVNFLFTTNRAFGLLLNCEICLYYYEDSVYIIPHEERPIQSSSMMCDRIQTISGVEEYHYQNSTDKPEEIPEDRWERRLEEWTHATTSFQQKMHFGNCSKILVNNPTQTNVMPIMYTLNKERKPYYGMTKDFMNSVNTFYETTVSRAYRKKIELSIDTSKYADSPNWMDSYRYVNKQISYLLSVNEKDFEEFKGHCDDVFIPLFKYMDLM